MNKQSIRIAAVSSILAGVLVLLGISGAMTTVSAAGVTINDGNPVTNYAQVLLKVEPPAGAFEMSIQNDDAPGAAAWVPVPDPAGWPFTMRWNLAATPGSKTVSVQYRDASLSPVPGKYSGKILLDYILDTGFASPSGYDHRGFATGGNSANGVAVDSQGRKVVVGTADLGDGRTALAVMRYLPDGTSLDPDFNGNQTFVFSNPSANTRCAGRAVAINADDSIVVVGSYDQDGAGDTDILVLKLLSSGELDTNFQANPFAVRGSVIYPGPGADSGNAVAIDGNGRIVVVGTYADGYYGNQVLVLRLNPGGSPDAAFGDLGTGEFIYGDEYDDSGNAVVIDAAGKIVVAGSYGADEDYTYAWLFRLDPDGLIDTGFGLDGDIAYTGDMGADSAQAVALDFAGNIIVVGSVDWTEGDTDIWVVKLTGDGSLDLSFNGTGSRSFGGTGADSGSAVAVQGSKVVVVGTYDNGGGRTSLWVSRLLGDGSLDASFNHGGDYAFGTTGRVAGRAVALQPDNRIIVSGAGNDASRPSSLLTLRLHGTSFNLTVNSNGTGTVAKYPDTFNGGATGTFVPDTVVTLTASPTGNASFLNWTNCPSTGGLQGEICTVDMNSASLPGITANFSPPVALNVSVLGTGYVTSSLSEGIYCSAGSVGTCGNSNLSFGSTVTLTATTGNWYTTFRGWSNDAAGCGTASNCAVSMNASKNVTAVFATNNTVRLSGASGAIGTYPTLEETYYTMTTPAIMPTATMTAQTMYYPEQATLDVPVALVFNGGKNTDFVTTTGFTTIKAPLIVKNGSLRVTFIKVLAP